MTNYAKIKDDDTLQRDIRTGVLISTNDELMKYRKRKANVLKERDRDMKLQSLESDVKDLKCLLKELLSKMS